MFNQIINSSSILLSNNILNVSVLISSNMTSLIAFYLNASITLEKCNIMFNGSLSNPNLNLSMYYQFGGILNLSTAQLNISACLFISTLSFTSAFNNTGFLGFTKSSSILFSQSNGSINWDFDVGW